MGQCLWIPRRVSRCRGNHKASILQSECGKAHRWPVAFELPVLNAGNSTCTALLRFHAAMVVLSQHEVGRAQTFLEQTRTALKRRLIATTSGLPAQ